MKPSMELRRELKRHFEPFMIKKGYVVAKGSHSSIVFRKVANNLVYLCDIQWDKYGRPRFVLNFGVSGVEGILDYEGKHIPSDKMIPSWAPVHGRLMPGRGQSTSAWFRLDRPL